MTEESFIENFMNCMKSSPGLARDVRQVLTAHMGDSAKRENYEGACSYRDLIRFLDKRILRGEKGGCADDSNCAGE